MTRIGKAPVAITTASTSGPGRARARWAPTSANDTPRIAQASRAMERTTPRAVPRIRRPRPGFADSAVVVKCQGDEVEELGEQGLYAGEAAAGAQRGVELAVQHVGPLQRAAAAIEQALDRHRVDFRGQRLDRHRFPLRLRVHQAEPGGEALLEGPPARGRGRRRLEQEGLDRDDVGFLHRRERFDRHGRRLGRRRWVSESVERLAQGSEALGEADARPGFRRGGERGGRLAQHRREAPSARPGFASEEAGRPGGPALAPASAGAVGGAAASRSTAAKPSPPGPVSRVRSRRSRRVRNPPRAAWTGGLKGRPRSRGASACIWSSRVGPAALWPACPAAWRSRSASPTSSAVMPPATGGGTVGSPRGTTRSESPAELV